MSTNLITHITALLERWDQMTAEASKKAEAADQMVQASFYAGVTFGIQLTHDELATALTNAIAEAGRPSASVM